MVYCMDGTYNLPSIYAGREQVSHLLSLCDTHGQAIDRDTVIYYVFTNAFTAD